MNRARWLVWLSAAAIIVSWLAAVACSEIVTVPLVRQQRGVGVVAELTARLPDLSIAQGDRGCTRGHYLAHGLNSYLRSRYGGTGRVNAACMYGGWAIILPEPTGFTLRQVVARTGEPLPSYNPNDRRDPLYQWNRQPLYVLDEYSAYTYGTLAGLESGDWAYLQGSWRYGRRMLRHAKALAVLCRETGYPQTAEVEAYVVTMEAYYRDVLDPLVARAK